ncbi:MAG TPA: cell division topological specificity factor MinE [Oceanobacillus sp.]|nr:cell division topological specificity factor MinE [Oceanobacillus sp.]
MVGLLERMLGRSSNKGSGSKAKERLEFILVHDRINLPPERLEEMKAEILEVISKYVAIDEHNVDIALQRRDRNPLLIAEIPFHKATEGIEKDDPDYKAEEPPPDEEGDDEEAKATE